MAQQQQQAQQQQTSAAASAPPPPFATMQFDSNSDYPTSTSTSGPGSGPSSAARPPPPFPTAQIDPCARITTRVYNPRKRTVEVVGDVLVGTMGPRRNASVSGAAGGGDGQAAAGGGGGAVVEEMDDSGSDWTSSESEEGQSEAGMDDAPFGMDDGVAGGVGGGGATTPIMSGSATGPALPSSATAASIAAGVASGGGAGGGATAGSSQPQQPPQQPQQPQRAYWLQRTLREAIYGRVRYGVVLRRRTQAAVDAEMAAEAEERRRSWNEPFQHPASAATPGALPQAQAQAQAAASHEPPPPLNYCEWEVTDEKCAVKEMSWNHIRREKHRLAEDPIKEVSAMQYLKKYLEQCRSASAAADGGSAIITRNASSSTFQTAEDMLDTHIMLPLDLLSDDRYLYSVMPYCDGGELFDRLDARAKFTEEESRYWMHQILKGLDNLQRAGICHRDMSLENLLVHKDRICLIIDMGMCLRIPYDDEDQDGTGQQQQQQLQNSSREPSVHMMEADAVMESFAEMNVDGDGSVTPNGSGGGALVAGGGGGSAEMLDHRRRRRYIVTPQGTCGKWHYMSPEIAMNKTPFDGHAVDMWATGVILFLMLTGFPPWERPCRTDERFKYMTAGYLVQMLTEWELGLSPDAMDLLQRMLWLDPKDRLSLEQVRAHPWMVNGRMSLSGGGDVGMAEQPR